MNWIERKFAHPRGEWTIEPDLKEWTDPLTNYKCKIMRGPVGSWCGYVTIPTSAFQKFHVALHARIREELRDINCHGGVTYTAVEDYNEAVTIGFDCNHYNDYSPGPLPLHIEGSVYRNLAFVEEECRKICRQALIILNTVV